MTFALIYRIYLKYWHNGEIWGSHVVEPLRLVAEAGKVIVHHSFLF